MAEQKTREQPAARQPVKVLGSAAESLDPAVQNLIAERETHERNGDAAGAQLVTARLAVLGVA